MDSFDKIRKEINIDLKNRLAENKKNYYFQLNLFEEEIIVKNKYRKLDNVQEMKNNKDTLFTLIEDKFIGINSKCVNFEREKISNLNLNYDKFINCSFKNLILENCSFSGSIFSNCLFENVEFRDCEFFIAPNDITIFSEGTKFKNCFFKNSNLENSIFKESEVCDTKFVLTNLKSSLMSNVKFKTVCITDCDCRSFKVVNSNIDILEFEDNFITKFDENTFIDKVEINKKDKSYYEKTYTMYRTIASKFEANRLPNNAGEYYFLAKNMEYRMLKGIDKVKASIFWMSCGYGERPTYALITSIEIILIFGIFYMFTGLNAGGEVIDYKTIIFDGLPVQDLFIDFMNSLYFSIVTFTTVGYGDITPIDYSIFLSGIEMFLGVTMVGIWTATLARKITR